jgi:hypothetical protein
LYLAFETARRLIPFLQYQGEKGWEPAKYPGLCEKILAKSQTVVWGLLDNVFSTQNR